MFLKKTDIGAVMWINTDHIEWAEEAGDGFRLHMTGNRNMIDILGSAAQDFQEFMRFSDQDWRTKAAREGY